MGPTSSSTRFPGGAAADRDALEKEIGVVARKTELLRSLGVDVSALEPMLKEARRAFDAKNTAAARKTLDALLVFFSFAAEEMSEILARFLGKPPPPGKGGKAGDPKHPTLEEIDRTMEEAFLKFLHSKSLRRMVEVIAMEKIRVILAEEILPEDRKP